MHIASPAAGGALAELSLIHIIQLSLIHRSSLSLPQVRSVWPCQHFTHAHDVISPPPHPPPPPPPPPTCTQLWRLFFSERLSKTHFCSLEKCIFSDVLEKHCCWLPVCRSCCSLFVCRRQPRKCIFIGNLR